MRIIAGKFKQRQLAMPKSEDVRPTSSRLRESVFNICRGKIEDARFLDICAGSGAMGFEALSRGAAMATFIEKDVKAVQAIRKNIEVLGVAKETRLIVGDLNKVLPRMSPAFDLIFADPPYNQGLSLYILELVDTCGLLSEDGWLMIEEGVRVDLPDMFGNLRKIDERKMGEARLWVYAV